MRQDHTFSGMDGDFHYIDWGGKGPLTHFAHATGFCAGMYSPLVKKLLPDLRVVGMDARGHGRTRAPAVPRKLKDWNIFADDLGHFFSHLNEPVIAIGHSLGAVASLILAAKRPELVRALILIDPTILPFSWVWWWFLAKKTGTSKFIKISARAAKRKRDWPNRKTIIEAYSKKQPFNTWKDGFLEAYIEEGTEKNTRGSVSLSCDPAWEARCFASCSHDIWRYIPCLRLPTLIIYGMESDTFLPAAVKRFRVTANNASFLPLEKTGHFVPMERPTESAEAIMNFLRILEFI